MRGSEFTIALPVRVEYKDFMTQDGGVFMGDIVDSNNSVICGLHTPTGCTGGAHETQCGINIRKLNAIAKALNGNAKRDLLSH